MRNRIIAQVESNGPMPFDEFMEMCLYDPEDGFFTSGRIRPGEDADFVTSPEVSPWFGRLVGRWAAGTAVPGESVLIEIGSGTGSLLEPLLDEVGTTFSQVFAVEVSPAARLAVAQRIPSVTVVPKVADVPTVSHAVVIVNEVLDNLPVRLVERTNARWTEFLVEALDGVLTLVQGDADELLSVWCDHNLGDVPEGRLFTAQIEAERWVAELLAAFDSVSLCLIDYAATTTELETRRRHDVIRTYHRQHSGFGFLGEPGLTDITADVNIDVIRSALVRYGGTVDLIDQRAFLSGLGALEVLADLKEHEFAHARSGDVVAQLTTRSEATGLRAILDDRGLGGFSVFVATLHPDTFRSRSVA